jgi:predicted RNase H-like HicB family nuclease
MTYLVILDQHDDRFTATVPALPGCAVDAPTREQAIAAVRNAIGERLTRSEIVTVDAPPGASSSNPWLQDAGMLAGHPSWQVFQEGVHAARQEVNETAS